MEIFFFNVNSTKFVKLLGKLDRFSKSQNWKKDSWHSLVLTLMRVSPDVGDQV